MKHPINVELIKLAQRWGYWDGNTAEFNDVGLEEFAAAIRASEREACAQLCDEYVVPVSIAGAHPDYLIGKQMAFQQVARAIRARGEG